MSSYDLAVAWIDEAVGVTEEATSCLHHLAAVAPSAHRADLQ